MYLAARTTGLLYILGARPNIYSARALGRCNAGQTVEVKLHKRLARDRQLIWCARGPACSKMLRCTSAPEMVSRVRVRVCACPLARRTHADPTVQLRAIRPIC